MAGALALHVLVAEHLSRCRIPSSKSGVHEAFWTAGSCEKKLPRQEDESCTGAGCVANRIVSESASLISAIATSQDTTLSTSLSRAVNNVEISITCNRAQVVLEEETILEPRRKRICLSDTERSNRKFALPESFAPGDITRSSSYLAHALSLEALRY